LIARGCSGAFCGWTVASLHGTPIAGTVLAAAGAAIIGAYVGLFIRSRAITLIGPVPAGLLEDVVTAAASVAVVAYV